MTTISKDLYMKIIEMRRDGYTYKDIAEILNTYYSVVKEVIRDWQGYDKRRNTSTDNQGS